MSTRVLSRGTGTRGIGSVVLSIDWMYDEEDAENGNYLDKHFYSV